MGMTGIGERTSPSLARGPIRTDIPWYALAMLDLGRGRTFDHRAPRVIRNYMERGEWDRVLAHPERVETWEKMCDQAVAYAKEHPLQRLRDAAAKDPEGILPATVLLREAGLWSPRAFCEIINFRDRSDGTPVVLEDFHLQVIFAIRQNATSSEFLPLYHGKSALGSLLVPLIDWAEWPDAREMRIYWGKENRTEWVPNLMFEVEHNKALHAAYPWIRRPIKGDVSQKWGETAFSIGGRTMAGVSFRALLTRGFSIGLRAHSIGGDDWVTYGNCSSLTVQDKLYGQWLQAMSMTERAERPSKYGTVWGRTFYVGTLYDRRDCGVRISAYYKEKGLPTLRYDVYREGSTKPESVLWPAKRPADWVEGKRIELQHLFDLRMRNIISDNDLVAFPLRWIERSCLEQYKFGEIPARARAMIGFDPAMGKTTKHAADPAIALYGEVDDPDEDRRPVVGAARPQRHLAFTAHFIAWQRLRGHDFDRQIQTLITWGRQHQRPIVIENNTLQGQYIEKLNQLAPDLEVVDHRTGAEKWNKEDGVTTFRTLFANKRLVIHTGGAPQDELRALITQFAEWPQSRYKDLAMAFWFAKFKIERRRTSDSARQGATLYADLPDYASGFGGGFGGYNLR